ncbi:MAG: hypothetical protein AAFW75_27135 [Cyanobacteria bacterium J06636_16]
MELTDDQKAWVLETAGWKVSEPDSFMNWRWLHDLASGGKKTDDALAHPITTVALMEWLMRERYQACMDCADNFGIWVPDSDAPGGEALALGSSLNEAVIAAALEVRGGV